MANKHLKGRFRTISLSRGIQLSFGDTECGYYQSQISDAFNNVTAISVQINVAKCKNTNEITSNSVNTFVGSSHLNGHTFRFCGLTDQDLEVFYF